MSLWNIISNTVEGVAEATVNAGKLAIGVIVAPIAPEAVKESVDGIKSGVSKIGDSSDRSKDSPHD